MWESKTITLKIPNYNISSILMWESNTITLKIPNYNISSILMWESKTITLKIPNYNISSILMWESNTITLKIPNYNISSILCQHLKSSYVTFIFSSGTVVYVKQSAGLRCKTQVLYENLKIFALVFVFV